MAESSASHEDETEFKAAGSEVTFDVVCTPCDNDGDIKEAEVYCKECHEYLCFECIKHHKKVTNTKHHICPNMPGTTPVSDNCIERCQIHKDEVIKYYCRTHKSLICGECLFRNHGKCRGKVYISDEAKNLTDSKEFKNVQAWTWELIKRSEGIIKTSKKHGTSSSGYRDKILQDVEAFRQEINGQLDDFQAALEQQIGEMTAQHEAAMNSIVDKTNEVLTELQYISSEMKTLLNKKQICQMFMKMKKHDVKLESLQGQLDKTGASCSDTFIFKPSEDLRDMLKRTHALGQVRLETPRKIKATHTTDIYVKSNGDASKCRVNGATLLSKDKLVISDFDNFSVKLINPELKSIVSEYKFGESPRGITSISSNKVAVTLPDAKQISLLIAEDTLILDRDIKVNNRCWRIACIDDKLAVSFKDSNEVLILSLAGETLQTFSTSSTGEQLFISPPRLTVSTFTQAIYATDSVANSLTMLDMDGNVIAQYKDHALKSPANSAVDDMGMVYVCGIYSSNIHQLTPYCSKVNILLTDVKWPLSVCLCRETRKLYVGMAENDYIKVYQLS